jgi:hypothetical protein
VAAIRARPREVAVLFRRLAEWPEASARHAAVMHAEVVAERSKTREYFRRTEAKHGPQYGREVTGIAG